MAVATHLVDKSAWARSKQPAVRAALLPLLDRGLLATCAVVDLEVLYSTRNATDHARGRAMRSGFEWLPLTDEIGSRAIEVQALLAAQGHHRAASVPDLLIAATAERHGVTVLHYDADFDTIAAVTGQPSQWVVPAGTAD
ncbi:PIN domain nuclease [Streptomyces sp. Z26]|uniref:PIN domain nuclease n=1 Tax=Streptomyces sp. Z26 TaxID=2500177 RepID=UPI000EF16432|nr:PIN domain nuclease [Streptomyces sp. Z26]RLL67449.1 PIN domain nuclease [Streptomyces sp. Z26]